MGKNIKDSDPLISRKILGFLELGLLILAFVWFISMPNPGIILLYIIVSIGLWQIGNRPRKQPYAYLFDKTHADGNLPYVPNSRFDQAYTPTIEGFSLESPKGSYSSDESPISANIERQKSIHSSSTSSPDSSINNPAMIGVSTSPNSSTTIVRPLKQKMIVTSDQIYQSFKEAKEYNHPWLNVETQTLALDEDDQVILSHWTPLRIQKKQSFADSFQQLVMLCVYFGIYGLLSYLILDRGENTIDNTIQALFFPVLPFILVCYKSLNKYLIALLLSFFLMSVVFIPLYRGGFISEAGIPFLKYFSALDDFFPSLYERIFDDNKQDNIRFTNNLLIAVFVIEFIFLLIYSLIHTDPYIDAVISKKAIYIRAKTKKSIWDIIVNVFWILFSPLNINQYKEVQNRIRYNRMTAKEGRSHDFSRINAEAIQKFKISKTKINRELLFGIGTLVIGIIGFSTIIGLPFLGISILTFIRIRKKRGTYTIMVDVQRSKVEGSWILSHKSDIFEFKRVPQNIAQFFQNYWSLAHNGAPFGL